MPYATAADLRRNLPRNGIGLTDSDIDSFITEWIERLGHGLPAGATPTESALSRSVVRVGATADAKKQMAARDSYLETPGLDAEIARAERLLREYRASTPAEEDDTAEDSPAFFGVTPW